MKIYNFNNITKDDYEAIKKHLDSSNLIIYPTETSYAVGANALDNEAVKKIFLLKQRDNLKPLPIVVKNPAMLLNMTYIKKGEEDLISIFWPGPLTILFEARADKKYAFASNSKYIGARVSSHIFIEELFQEIDYPIISTSANISSQESLIQINENELEHIFADYKDKDSIIVIDDGKLSGGCSTIVQIDSNNGKINIAREGNNNIKERLFCYIKNINNNK
ncbi:MAG: L-threonylcarbamoyladenylate synthase [Deltaproteobacteria bacterium]|nr:L-threonylcarbamoyladenylate synthase [Deltaproteobacteria bacterium]